MGGTAGTVPIGGSPGLGTGGTTWVGGIVGGSVGMGNVTAGGWAAAAGMQIT